MSSLQAMIKVENLSKSFGSLKAVDRVSFAVTGGEILGYLGPNGAGKSTTIKMMTGLLNPDEGFISINGINLSTNGLEAKKQFGFVPETGSLFEKLTPYEYLQLIGRIYKMESGKLDKKIIDMLELFDMQLHASERMTTFSKGMKQRITICAALLPNPPVLFFDEPLNGLDANTVILVKELLRKYAEQGKAIFYTSHLLDVVEKICDRIAIIQKGTIIAQGNLEELRAMHHQESLESVFSEITNADDAKETVNSFLENNQ
jgi:ABC-2 type transport system ATP-binding protein